MSSPPTSGRRAKRRWPTTADQPLLRILVAEATRKRITLAALAKALGITYERLAQFRRGEADIANASRETLTAAASFLDVPVVAVLMLAGHIRPQDFLWPLVRTAEELIAEDIEHLHKDPLFASFVTPALRDADFSVQRLVAMLYREACGSWPRIQTLPRWMQALQLASVENQAAEAVLARLREEALKLDGAL